MSARTNDEPVGKAVLFLIGFVGTVAVMARALLGPSSPLRPESTTVGNASMIALPIVWLPALAVVATLLFVGGWCYGGR